MKKKDLIEKLTLIHDSANKIQIVKSNLDELGALTDIKPALADIERQAAFIHDCSRWLLVEATRKNSETVRLT